MEKFKFQEEIVHLSNLHELIQNKEKECEELK